MSGFSSAHPNEREIASELRLRADPLPVARLSRKVLVGLGATVSVGVIAAVAYAMTDAPAKAQAAEVYKTASARPERLASLPKDYASAPKLGPPLPGDLGRPILEAQALGPSELALAQPADPAAIQRAEEASAARQRLAQERDSARMSRLFAAEARATGADVELALPGTTALPVAAGADSGLLGGIGDPRTTSPERLTRAPSPYVIQAGAVIPAALVTGIRSEIPGQIVGQVTEDVFDSPTGKHLLIPQGSRLIGVYDTNVEFGQSRLLLAWTRLILPDGRSLVLEKLPAGDAQGYAGLQDRVDRHWGTLAGMAALSTVLGIGAELGSGEGESAVLRALRRGGSNSMNQVGQEAVGRGLSVAPTLTIRPGAPVRVMVTRDLILEPYSR